ncbi:aldo/keto reductase [Pseudidiomarina sp.]|uniref:aldo/keto reductase n=1 Tax=Pseudidiomarina sp. TaxID=2081707 RepID=UPI003A97EEBF
MSINSLSQDNKGIFLGSAMWGWAVTKHDVFSLLDQFVERGECLIDHATNYPINGVKEDFGIGLNWLAEWLSMNPSSGLEVLVKIGSLNNLGGPECDLSPQKIEDDYCKIQDKLGDRVKCVSIHWDNRSSIENADEIISTLESLFRISRSNNCRIGISGIQDIELYSEFFSTNSVKPVIQVKENMLTSQARINYSKYIKEADYIAYGIHLGGLRQDSSGDTKTLRGIEHPEWLIKAFDNALHHADIKPSPNNFYDISLYLAHVNSHLSGVIIGPKNATQLKSMLDFWDTLKKSKNLLDHSALKAILTADSRLS